jgi:Uma2 family endonuclease
MSSTIAAERATLADLAAYDGKAELVAGELVPIMPTGYRPGVLAKRVLLKLDEYAEERGGVALGDNVGFVISEISTGRESFSPDAAYCAGPPPDDEMGFVPGAPDFAVEVRSESDYGPAAEEALAVKRAEYFEAGTLVVWDVDTLAKVVHRYRAGQDGPTSFGPGTSADAEPAVPGWTVSLDWLFR